MIGLLRRTPAVTLSLALLTTEAGAHGDGSRAVSLSVTIEKGSLPEHVRAELQRRVRDRLGRGVAGLARSDESDAYAVRLHVRHEGGDYEVTLELLRRRSGEVVSSASDRCEICGFEELSELAESLASKLSSKLEAVSIEPSLRLSSSPPGALVTLDGEVLGTTPLEIEVPPGEHDLSVTKPGHLPQLRRIVFVEGVRESIELTLTPEPRSARPARPLMIGGWTSLGAGLGALTGGVTLLALHGRPIRSDCLGKNVDVEGNCKWRYTTRAGGAVLTTIGAAATMTGIALLTLDRRRRVSSRAAVAPSLGGFTITGRF